MVSKVWRQLEIEGATALNDAIAKIAHTCICQISKVSRSFALIEFLNVLESMKNLKKKYADMDQFIEVYPSFQSRASLEKEKLFEVANWMHLVFRIISPTNNKELVLSAVTKFVGKFSIALVTDF